jgi:LmbE family N-acetylglucosaminyl deacetylase
MKKKSVAIIVAHPDDETLWAGGSILSHPFWQCFIVCLCRAGDTDRAPRFHRALKELKSEGVMGDLDDGPEQEPLDEKKVEQTVMDLLPDRLFDLVISHNPSGEYTRHLRHEEISSAVIKNWYTGKILAKELWTFAYEDGDKKYLPKPVMEAPVYRTLTPRIWKRKYSILTKTYGFAPTSWEVRTSPRAEAFWPFTNPFEARKWLNNKGLVT